MLVMDVIELVQPERASCIVIVPKKNGTLVFGVHYRKLNAVKTWVSYSIPCKDECIHLLGDATVFSTLDDSSGY